MLGTTREDEMPIEATREVDLSIYYTPMSNQMLNYFMQKGERRDWIIHGIPSDVPYLERARYATEIDGFLCEGLWTDDDGLQIKEQAIYIPLWDLYTQEEATNYAAYHGEKQVLVKLNDTVYLLEVEGDTVATTGDYRLYRGSFLPNDDTPPMDQTVFRVYEGDIQLKQTLVCFFHE